MATCKGWTKKGTLEEFKIVPTWKTKKGKASEFLDAGGYIMNERAGNWRLGMSRQRGVEKKNEFTLGTERCENIKYKNK